MILLTQTEADFLLAMRKVRVADDTYAFPINGQKLSIPLRSEDHREEFLLDIGSSRIDLLRTKYQNRARASFVLARLDVGGAPHQNPDGVAIACPHLHLHREGYGTKWAHPLPLECFSDHQDRWKLLEEFIWFCKIIDPPTIERGLFV